MKEKLKHIVMYVGLVCLWLFPLLYLNTSLDAEYLKTLGAYLLFLVAAILCRLLPGRHAAFLSAFAVGVGLCVFRPVAVYDILPALLLCCWLRCWREYEKGNAVRGYFEVITDLMYACFVAAVVRLIRNGFSFIKIEKADIQTIPDLCLMAIVLLFFVFSFFFCAKKQVQFSYKYNEKKNKESRVERKIVGLIPLPVSFRTFLGLCVLLLLASLLQYTNAALIPEDNLLFRSGFRLLFFPWMVLLVFVLTEFFQKNKKLQTSLSHQKKKQKEGKVF